MTVEKRGDPPGMVAWRFIARDDQIDTEGAEREVVHFDDGQTYFWQASWRNNFFNLLIREGGVPARSFTTRANTGKAAATSRTRTSCTSARRSAGAARSGASVDGVIVRQVWVSSGPRPPHANQ